MEFYPFPALLQSPYNGIREFGQASVAGDGNAIDFEADFVPLAPLGTQATVSWIRGNEVADDYVGQVYLSSPNLLRIVDVDPEQIAWLRLVFSANTLLPAQLFVPNRHPWPGKPAGPLPANIIYLAPDAIKLRTPVTFEAEQPLLLNTEVDFLTLADLGIRVRKQIFLRRQDSILLCAVENCSEENLIALSAYTARLEHLGGGE